MPAAGPIPLPGCPEGAVCSLPTVVIPWSPNQSIFPLSLRGCAVQMPSKLGEKNEAEQGDVSGWIQPEGHIPNPAPREASGQAGSRSIVKKAKQ